MQLLFDCVGTVLQIFFAYLFCACFLKNKRGKKMTVCFLILASVVNGLYGFFGVEGIYGYLMYLLCVVLMLLYLFGESGAGGVWLMVWAFLIPICLDGVVETLVANWRYPGDEIFVLVMRILAVCMASGFYVSRHKGNEEHGYKQSSQDWEALLLLQHMEMNQESMKALEYNYRLQRKNAHEFEHHLQVIGDLLDGDEVVAAREYVCRLRRNRSIHVMSVRSNHPVVDVILNQKYQIAGENEIKMQIKVNDLSKVDIPGDDLSVIFTNLLDNAIEACRRQEGYREILCSVILEDALYISIRNTSAPVEIMDGRIITSKQDSLSHGFGLMSVGHVLDNLEAEYTYGYEDGYFQFAAEIELQ